MPMQAFCNDVKEMTVEYAAKVFENCDYGTIPTNLEKDDTIIVCSDGVHDNLSPVQLGNLATEAYKWNEKPEVAAEKIVKKAIENASLPGGKPDDVTAVVAYVFEENTK